MTAEKLLLGLEAHRPYLLLAPLRRVPGRSVYPLTPTEVLRRYRRLGVAYLNNEVANICDILTRPPTMIQCHLEPWGWCEVVEPVLLEANEEMGGEFPGTKAVAYAVARADEWVKPVPVGKEWWLVHALLSDVEPMLTSCAFWLHSRHAAFLEALEAIARQREPLSDVLARHLTAPPDTPIQ